MSRLATAIWGPDHDPERCYFVFHNAYYDVSGSQGDRGGFIVAAGLLGTEVAWNEATRAWEKALSDAGMRYMHTKKYVQYHRPFSRWFEEPEPESFVPSLAAAAGRGVAVAYTVAFSLDDFRAIDRQYRFAEAFGAGDEKSGAYAVATLLCTAQIHKWARDNFPAQNIQDFYEGGDAGQEAMLAFMRVNTFGLRAGYSVLPKQLDDGTRVRPLEMADMVAYPHRRYYAEAGSADEVPYCMKDRELKVLRHVRGAMPINSMVTNKAGISALIERTSPDDWSR